MLLRLQPSPARTSVAIWLRREPEHAPLGPGPQRRVLPGLGEGADDEGLAGSCGADQRLDPRAGGEHAAHGGGLVGAELDARLGEIVDEALRRRRRTCAAAPASLAAAARSRSVCTCSGVA